MARSIRALRLSFAPHRQVWALAAGRLRPGIRMGGAGSPLRLEEIPAPARPPGWVRIAPTLAGICASDRKFLSPTETPTVLLPFFRLPPAGIVLGHEIVGTVIDADPGAAVGAGDRVVAEPLLSCVHKGLPRCTRCAAGRDNVCAHIADRGNAVRGGFGFGFDARFGGGWGEELVAPADLVHRVPDRVDDRSAVLAEPTAVGVQAVLAALPHPEARCLVIGPGGVGLTLLVALRALRPGAHVTMAGVAPFSTAMAARTGAHATLTATGPEAVVAAADLLGSPLRGNVLSGPVLEDGFDVVFDTVGSDETIEQALRSVRPGGEVVLLATAFTRRIDLSLVWHRQLRIRGSAYYGTSDVPGGARVTAGRRRDLRIALDVLAESRPDHLVTHRYPLTEAVAALTTAAAGPASDAVRVAFAPGTTDA